MKKNIVIVILVLLVLGLGGYIAYDKLYAKEDKNIENKEKEDTKTNETKKDKLYHIEESDVLGKIISVTHEGDHKYDYTKDYKNIDSVVKDYNVKFSYPVIDIDSKDAKRINSEIKKIYDEDVKQLNIDHNEGYKEGIQIELANGEEVYSYYISWTTYTINETEDVLSIIGYDSGAAFMTDDSDHYFAYNIDKKTGNELTTEELLKKFNLTEDKILKNIVNSKDEFSYSEAWDEIDLSEEEKIAGIKELEPSYMISEDKKIMVTFEDISGFRNDIFVCDSQKCSAVED